MTGLVGTVLGDILAQVSSYHLTKRHDRMHLRAVQRLAPSTAGHKGQGGGAQVLEEEEEGDYSKEGGKSKFSYDLERTARLCLWSIFVGTPIGHFWYMFLDRNICPATPTAGRAVLGKLALDQLVMSPAGLALFFWGIKLLEGGTLQEARANVASKFGPTLMANYVLWPAANFVNFRFIPSEQRILYINVIALFWTAYMSHMASKTTPAVIVAHTHTSGGGTAAAATASITTAAASLGGSRARHAVLHMKPAGRVDDSDPAGAPLCGSTGAVAALGRSRRGV